VLVKSFSSLITVVCIVSVILDALRDTGMMNGMLDIPSPPLRIFAGLLRKVEYGRAREGKC
jgi:hypothetical protein